MLPKSFRHAIAALLLTASLAGPALAAPGDVGTPASDFNLEALAGGFHQLSDYQGKVVVLFIIGYG